MTLFEKLCEDGNLLISLDEMNARDMARKLSIVEKDPAKVWDALDHAYGFGYFNAVIDLYLQERDGHFQECFE